MARLMLSCGMFSALAAAIAVRSRALLSGFPPPLAAMAISLSRRVKILPRLASSAPFLCLIVAHLEWPDMETSIDVKMRVRARAAPVSIPLQRLPLSGFPCDGPTATVHPEPALEPSTAIIESTAAAVIEAAGIIGAGAVIDILIREAGLIVEIRSVRKACRVAVACRAGVLVESTKVVVRVILARIVTRA